MCVSRRLGQRPRIVVAAARAQESFLNLHYDVVHFALLPVSIHLTSPAALTKAWSALQHAQMRTRRDHT